MPQVLSHCGINAEHLLLDGIGHKVPQEAPEQFSTPIVDVANREGPQRYSSLHPR